jgi:hypothetical protein
VIDSAALQMVLGVLTGWIARNGRRSPIWLKKTGSCGANSTGVDCVSRTMIVAGWLRGRIAWAERCCARSEVEC